MFKKKKNKALNLTPLIDVMTTLIIFILIQSSDSAVRVNDSVKLAQNEFGENVKKNENIVVGLKELKFGDDFSMKLNKGHFNKKDSHKKENRLVKSLYTHINNLREDFERENGDSKKMNINLSFDKRIPSESVKKVVYTAAMAGVDNIFYIGEDKQ